MTEQDVPEFTARLKQLASAWPGRWFFDEGTVGAYWPVVEAYEREDVWEALVQCVRSFRDPPSAFQVAEVVRLVAANRARAEAIRRAPPTAGYLPVAESVETGNWREPGWRLAQGLEQFADEHRGQDRGRVFFAYLREAGLLDTGAGADRPPRPGRK